MARTALRELQAVHMHAVLAHNIVPGTGLPSYVVSWDLDKAWDTDHDH